MTDSDGGAEESAAELVEEYDDLLATLDVLENEALRKVESGRVYDPENERTRIKWIQIAKDVVAEKRKLVEARDLKELDDADDDALRILVEETIVGTEWSGDDANEPLDAGETRTETSELILGGDS